MSAVDAVPADGTAGRAADYARKKARLEREWTAGPGELKLAKPTISNLFRYQPTQAGEHRISLGEFNHVISLDADALTMDVEGLTTFEHAASFALERGFVPHVVPELKHITVGGATVGIGIESTCFRHGFVHDMLREADVLLPSGHIVTATATNEYADLFHALPNSYGTLGYILRARIAIEPAKPHVELDITQFTAIGAYLDAMKAATETGGIDFVEGLVFEDGRYYLMVGRYRDQVPRVDDILRRNVFYKLVQTQERIHLRTHDYLFRYDPEWFWNLPDGIGYALFRRFAPARFRNSSFYTRYVAWKEKTLRRLPGAKAPDTEPLIQDWEVPWRHGEELLEFALREVNLDGRPWAAVPIRTPRKPTLYPVEPNELYFNLGCYLQVRKVEGKEPYYYTKILDSKCFELDGIKMLYSSSFMTEEEFDARYNGAAYRELKRKYDPEGRARGLYQKVVL